MTIINKSKSILLFPIILLLTSCPNSPTNTDNDDISPWSHYGMENKSIRKLRLFDDQIYAITRQKGLYRKDISDEVSEWQYLGFEDTLNEWQFAEGVLDVYVNANIPHRIMVSIYQTGYKTDPSIHTVFVSQDDGVTWQPSDSGLVWGGSDSSLYNALPAKLEGLGDKVYAVTNSYGGIYVSEEFGTTWDVLHKGYTASCHDLYIHPVNTQVMWAVSSGPWGDSSIGKTSDGGITWQGLPQSFASHYQFVDDIALHPINPDIVYVGAEGNVYKTDDFGDTWVQIFSGDSLDISSSTIILNDNQLNHLVVYGSNNTDFRSIQESLDGGISWREINYPYEFHINYRHIFDSLNEALYFPTEEGVLKYNITE